MFPEFRCPALFPDGFIDPIRSRASSLRIFLDEIRFDIRFPKQILSHHHPSGLLSSTNRDVKHDFGKSIGLRELGDRRPAFFEREESSVPESSDSGSSRKPPPLATRNRLSKASQRIPARSVSNACAKAHVRCRKVKSKANEPNRTVTSFARFIEANSKSARRTGHVFT